MKGLVPQHVLDLHNSNKKTSKDEFYCLFADISGFTKITQTLMKDGFQGAEVLETKINSLFFEMIEKVHGCNGFVGTFAGDALTVFFERGSDCFECSLLLQQCFEDNQDFKLKVGIAFGEVQTHIFGERKKAFTFYGEPLDLAAQAEKFCEPEQSAYHNSAQAGLLEGLKTREIEQGFHQIMNNRKVGDFSSRSPLTIENDPTEFLLPGVDSLQFEGEFRQVGILFVSFLLNDLSLSDYMEQVLQICEETDVNLGLIDFGDKGAKLLLFIGAPQARENYAFKLLSCAKKLSRIDQVSQRMGVSLGHVYAGLMGHKDRQTYSILGEKVNLGARLMGLASWGQILCEERVMRKTRDQAAFDLLGKFELKGFAQTTLVYSFDDFVDQTETAIQGKIKFYGRKQELKILTDFLADESQRGLILVCGVSGVGKSCLT